MSSAHDTLYCRQGDLDRIAKDGDGTLYVVKGQKPFSDWVALALQGANEAQAATTLPAGAVRTPADVSADLGADDQARLSTALTEVLIAETRLSPDAISAVVPRLIEAINLARATNQPTAVASASIPDGWEIKRVRKGPFENIHLRSPHGHALVTSRLGRSYESALYALADALLAAPAKPRAAEIDRAAPSATQDKRAEQAAGAEENAGEGEENG